MMKHALFVATVGGFFNFEGNDITILQSMGYEVHCAANFSLSEWNDFRAGGIIRHQIDFARIPWSKTNLAAYREMRELLSEVRFDLVHCHTPMGGVIARIAARRYRKAGMKVIYTAHGFHFFKGAPLKNWLLYFPVEWVLAHWTDVLITINKEDYRLAKRYMRAGRVEYIPGVGIDMEKLSAGHTGRNEMRRKLGVGAEDYMLLSVGELSKRKNVSVVIKALSRTGDERIRYYICGTGPEEGNLRELIRECRLEGRVHLLGFRSDIADLLGAADLFVHPSLQEGLPVALMEAIAAKTPVICSDIRGNTDLVPEKELLFDPHDEDSVLRCIQNAMDTDMSAVMERHYETLKRYDLKNVSQKMEIEYEQVLRLFPDSSGGVKVLYEKQAVLEELGKDRPAYILLSVGELSERKNQETVIRALGKLHRPDIVYLIAGEGSLEGKFRNLIKEFNLENQVFLLGHREDVATLYDLADVFVHTSVREGLGMAPLEAMAKGLPLISSYVNGMKDYTLDGITGICITRPTDVEETALAITKMISCSDEWKEHQSINHMITRRFTDARSRKRMEEIYRQAEFTELP